MNFKIKENLPVVVEKYPYYESLNKKILEDSKYLYWKNDVTNSDGGPSNVKALRTDGFDAYSVKSIGRVVDWVREIVRNVSYGSSRYALSSGVWMAKYKKGEYTVSHTHPGDFSFVYFVKTPSGSSPLVFTTSGKRIKAEEGKLILFSSRLKHHVPKNRCDNRIVLSGNLVQSTNDK